ncbi:MAG: hypothetical protein J3K34DRAFT_449092 [Monoraphidium minutum]|nr:MAG: hypothetical protein J3K34DRAFT_449092 [Monoraphidium minutum]
MFRDVAVRIAIVLVTTTLLAAMIPSRLASTDAYHVSPREPSFDELAGCIEDLMLNLPLKRGSCQLQVHHLIAETGKWNQDIRLTPLPVDASLLRSVDFVLYVGGNTEAADAAGIFGLFPHTVDMHILEPVPSFYRELVSRLSGKQRIYLHNFGLANSTKSVQVSKQAIVGQGTIVMNAPITSAHINETETLNLLSPGEFLRHAGIFKERYGMLHVNCEGCEYEMFEALANAGLLNTFPIIQFSFHWYTQVGSHLGLRYCRIRSYLSRSHKPVVLVPYGWERWVQL